MQLREAKDYFSIKKNGREIIFSPDFTESETYKLSENIEELLSSSRILKDSRSVKAGLAHMENGTEIFIKRYNRKTIGDDIKNIFRKGKAVRSFLTAIYCRQMNIPVPVPVASIQIRSSRVLIASYLVTLAIPNPIETDKFFLRASKDEKLKYLYLKSLAFILVSLHKAGVKHRDAKLSNFYVSATPDCSPEKMQFGTWDLDGSEILASQLGKKACELELARTLASWAQFEKKYRIQDSKNAVAIKLSGFYNELSSHLTDPSILIKLSEKYEKH